MQLPDVNVLTYAHREDAPEHDRYAVWLRTLTEADEPFALSEVVLASFLRIVTNTKIFDPPTPMETAIAFCQRLVDWPRAVMIAPSRHWDIFVRLCSNIRAPLVTDVYLAALAIEHGCELITTDSDFARFAGLRWQHPSLCGCGDNRADDRVRAIRSTRSKQERAARRFLASQPRQCSHARRTAMS